MKKLLGILGILVLVLSMLVVSAVPALAAKPASTGSQTYGWSLSGDVMPVPPYGSRDIPGSDTASKLIVNQPNGNTVVTMTGVMGGLHPETTYTVFVSNGYTSYADTGWNVSGTWNFDVISTKYPGTYSKTMTIIQDAAGHLTGAGYNVLPGYTWSVVGDVSENTITLALSYNELSGYVATLVGTIAADGTISGNWHDNLYGDSGPWASTTGTAAKIYSGTTSWPGLFTGTVQPFTFMTDTTGAGSWHVNLTDADLPETGPYNLSVWINEAGGTMLISDNFQVTKG